jgi:hypothetical protein
MGQDFSPGAFFERFADSPHLEVIGEVQQDVIDHEVGLGMLKKVRGLWEFDDSGRVTGERISRTWRVLDGFTSLEVLREVEQALVASDNARRQFTCEGRGCGSAAQWANRVFGERLLYGRADMQRYRVYTLPASADGLADASHIVLFYAAARTSDRQYLHMEVLSPGEQAPGEQAPGEQAPGEQGVLGLYP